MNSETEDIRWEGGDMVEHLCRFVRLGCEIRGGFEERIGELFSLNCVGDLEVNQCALME
jgi:hypothetical protein